jgi:hypothetical protein
MIQENTSPHLSLHTPFYSENGLDSFQLPAIHYKYNKTDIS